MKRTLKLSRKGANMHQIGCKLTLHLLRQALIKPRWLCVCYALWNFDFPGNQFEMGVTTFSLRKLSKIHACVARTKEPWCLPASNTISNFYCSKLQLFEIRGSSNVGRLPIHDFCGFVAYSYRHDDHNLPTNLRWFGQTVEVSLEIQLKCSQNAVKIQS